MSTPDVPSDHGRFCWYDLMSTDAAASRAFYTRLLGWTVKATDMSDHPYSMIHAGERAVGGIVPLEGDEIPTHWIPYIAVDDVQAACDRAAALGGEVCVPPTDIGPGVFAVVTDPQGGLFSPWQGKEPVGPPPARGEPGVFCWHECMSTDAAGSQAFYTGLFGWTTETADMEVGGQPVQYRMFKRQGEHFGGTLQLPPEAQKQGARTHWLNYVNVEDVDAAVKKAAELGASVLCPPTSIPQAGRFCVIQDPQGAVLALFRGEG
jgi:predicted enzyme related to lactoylglutathione lyase